MKVKVSEATNAQLNWMVAKAIGENELFLFDLAQGKKNYLPTTDWEHGGAIKYYEGIVDGLVPRAAGLPMEWWASMYRDPEYCCPGPRSYGPTPLVAIIRCYVESKLGREVDIPEQHLFSMLTAS